MLYISAWRYINQNRLQFSCQYASLYFLCAMAFLPGIKSIKKLVLTICNNSESKRKLPGTDSVMSSADRRSKLRWTELRVAAVHGRTPATKGRPYMPGLSGKNESLYSNENRTAVNIQEKKNYIHRKRKKVRKKQKRLRPGRPKETRGCRQDAAHPRWHECMKAKKAPRRIAAPGKDAAVSSADRRSKLRWTALGARGVFALTPLEIEISGKQKPKEKVISTKSEFR